MEGKRQITLVNHDGVYFLNSEESSDLKINIDEESKVAYYDIKVPWEKISPFHPLLKSKLGLNFVYSSQNDDGSAKRLLLTSDNHYDSERVLEKHYVPVEFQFSDSSELQFALEMESNLLFDNTVKAKTIIYSPTDQEGERLLFNFFLILYIINFDL